VLAHYHDKAWVPAELVGDMYGCHRQTLWRWEHDEKLGFPKAIRVGKKKYWVAGELRAFQKHMEQQRFENELAA